MNFAVWSSGKGGLASHTWFYQTEFRTEIILSVFNGDDGLFAVNIISSFFVSTQKSIHFQSQSVWSLLFVFHTNFCHYLVRLTFRILVPVIPL